MKLVRPEGAGLADVPGPNASYSVRLTTLFEVLDAIDDQKRGARPSANLFPWYENAVDLDAQRQPGLADCHKPADVMSSLEGIERELKRKAHKYPSEWKFFVPQADGGRKPFTELNAFYKLKPVRLFSDHEGCWAVETGTPLGFPVHHDLGRQSEVVVRLDAGGPAVTVGIEKTSFLDVHRAMLQQMKLVCAFGIQSGSLVLTMSG